MVGRELQSSGANLLGSVGVARDAQRFHEAHRQVGVSFGSLGPNGFECALEDFDALSLGSEVRQGGV